MQFKPGLFPPYYADMPESFVDIVLSEKKYLDDIQNILLRPTSNISLKS